MESGKLFLAVIAIFAIVAGSVWAFNLNPFGGSTDASVSQPIAVLAPETLNQDNLVSEQKVITSSGSNSGSNGNSDQCKRVYVAEKDVFIKVCD